MASISDSSDESEAYSDVSFGWIKIPTNGNIEKGRNTENMASISDSDSSDNTSISDLIEHTPDDSENEKTGVKEERNSESGDSDVDSTSSEEETRIPGDVKTGVTVNNVHVSCNDDLKCSEESRIPDITKTVADIEVSEGKSFDSDDPESYSKEHQELLKVPRNYMPLEVSGGLKLEDISDDDEVWMVQCPISINPEDLKNKNIVFGGTSEFSIKQENEEEQFFETSSYIDVNKLTCLLPTRKSQQIVAKVIEPAGLMVIKENICVPDIDIDPVPTQRNFNIPKDLKVRHPLFGSGYQQELDSRKELTVKRMKHKAKDKSDINYERKRKMGDDETKCSSESKKQKLREQFIPEEHRASEDCGVEISIKHKKNKKKKSKNRTCEAQDLDNEENTSKKKKKKSKNRDYEIQNLDSEENIPKKKKNKSKSRDFDSQNLSSEDTVSKNSANEES